MPTNTAAAHSLSNSTYSPLCRSSLSRIRLLSLLPLLMSAMAFVVVRYRFKRASANAGRRQQATSQSKAEERFEKGVVVVIVVKVKSYRLLFSAFCFDFGTK